MGRVSLPVLGPRSHDPFLSLPRLGGRRAYHLSQIHKGRLLYLWLRSSGTGTSYLSLCPLSSGASFIDVRTFRHPTYPGVHRFPRHAVLALSKLFNVVALSVCNCCDLGVVRAYPVVLS